MLGLESGGGALFVLELMKSLTSIPKEYLCLADSILSNRTNVAKTFGMCYTKHNYREDCDYNDYKLSQQRHDKTEQSQ